MKFNQYIYYVTLAGFVMVSAGCKKYLDQSPDMRTQLNSTEKVAQLLVSAYPKSEYLGFTENASDNAEDKGPSSEYTPNSASDSWEAAYFWRDYENGGQIVSTSDRYWSEVYLAIAAANNALEYIAEHPNDATLAPYKGEALVARAYSHFMLVSLYAKTYEIGGTNATAGIPYVTAPEKIVEGKYDRETVAITYAKIEKDLTEGIPLLKNSVYKVPKYHFTTNAAHAFAARFYLFKGDFEKVAQHANSVLVGGAQTRNLLRPWNTTYNSIVPDAFNTLFTQSSQNSSLLIAEANSAWGRNFRIRYSLGATIVATTAEAANVSGGRYAYRQFNREPFYSFRKFKELFFESQIGSGFGQPYVMVPLLTADELLMNRAEAYAMSGQNDLALQDINDFLSTRILNYNSSTHNVNLEKITAFYGITDPKQGLIKTILDLKRVEFISEGLRWFDLNRHKMTIRHLILDDNRRPSFIELSPEDPRRVFQLPKAVEKAGIALNPR